MNITFQHATSADLDAIMPIEQAGFNADEASSRNTMLDRINNLSDTFIVAKADGKVVGFIVGAAYNKRYLDDQLYEKATPNDPADAYQTVLSIAVAPDQQGHGIASQLLTHIETIAKRDHRKAVTLTCLQRLIPFYEKNGYVNEGESDSSHAGEVWYNMVKPLN
ncbi:GNAT family N-acetyltransferase [Nicoliella lavandulae]|uniref:GNAT family N-acetyltransferase n=1 Tax=Nicoliella lavandulae TaxID=3082954 RepID=A0ABU8SJ04_9LACO